MRERRVAIVTGASSGIGRALAERAVRAGWDVFAVGRRTERLDELESVVATAMGRVETLALDLREPGAARRIVRATLDRFGRLDVLVNCAGGTAVGRITEQNDEALYEQMETHVIVPLALAREAMPSLRASQGLVIFFGSGVARIPVGTLGAYPPAKAAVRSMARIARNELAADGVAVTYVDPGAVATEFMTRVGYTGPPASIAASPYDVARAVFAAFTSRPAVVNAVPWQTLFVALAEAFPRLTDAILARSPGLIGGDPTLPRVPDKAALPFATSPLATPPFPEPDVEDETSRADEAPESFATYETSEATPIDDDQTASAHEAHREADAEETIEAASTDDAVATHDSEDSDLDDSIAADPIAERPMYDDQSHDEPERDRPAHDEPMRVEHDVFAKRTADHESELPETNEDADAVSAVQNLLVTAPPPHEAANAAIDAMLAGEAPVSHSVSNVSAHPADSFEGAIEPHLARMKKLNLKTAYVRALLVPDTELDLGYVAMRWAGMPNKNERGLTAQVLESLADAGFLDRVGRERYRVLREPGTESTA